MTAGLTFQRGARAVHLTILRPVPVVLGFEYLDLDSAPVEQEFDPYGFVELDVVAYPDTGWATLRPPLAGVLTLTDAEVREAEREWEEPEPSEPDWDSMPGGYDDLVDRGLA